jgi:uncharacterized damage-inducible protein DinB
MNESRLSAALERIRIARMYTKMFLKDLQPDDWFWQPHEGVTHLAWQVGHLASAQYMLCLRRVRGESDGDEQLMSAEARKAFGRDSVPAPQEQTMPAPEILAALDRVFNQSVAELTEYDDQQLDVEVQPPHPLFKTKLGAVQWCSQHELVHAGQIALLRRLMGKAPLR